MTSLADKLYGWFDDASQTIPTYDPPHDADCPYCGTPCTPDDVRTHSLLIEDAPNRSYFYRTHRTCDERSRSNNMDSAIIEQILRREHSE